MLWNNLSDSDIKILPVIATILVALAGYLYKYFDDRAVRSRASKLALVNKRMEDFYGPLYFRLFSGEEAYQTLLRKLNKKSVSDNPSQEELAEWRIWYKEVFHPYNLEIEEIITNNSYLTLEQTLPKPLLEFVAHISEYKAIVGKWEKGDYTDHFAHTTFPKKLRIEMERSYDKLKDIQMKLLQVRAE